MKKKKELTKKQMIRLLLECADLAEHVARVTWLDMHDFGVSRFNEVITKLREFKERQDAKTETIKDYPDIVDTRHDGE